MSLEKFINGIHNGLIQRDQLIIEAIVKSFELDEEEVAKIIYAALDADKTVKSMKLQARKPKSKGKKQKKRKSGYQTYCDENREKVKALLKNKESERTFKNKQGKTIALTEADFKEGEPKFEHITQKCASLWWALTPEEREKYVQEAKNFVTEVSVESASVKEKEPARKKGSGRKAVVSPPKEKEGKKVTTSNKKGKK